MGIAGVGLPSGLVTFLFTDIEGSTRLLSTMGSGFDAVLDLHHETLRTVWATHRGHEINTEGDAFLVAFASADDAVDACVAAQRALASAPWPEGVEVRVRMGIHTGYAEPRNDDYSALALNQAARVVGAAHGGQIVLTADTAVAMDREPPVPMSSRGRFRVRDFDGPVELFTVEASGWTDPGRPLRVRPADGHNLVPFLTEMVDRDDDRAWLHQAVGAGALATVAGPGGGGKTRLAIEFGLDVAGRWPDGVWFVDLSLVRSPEHVIEAIAEAVGAVPTPGAPVIEDARGHLVGRELLLIVDNCEHVVAEVGRVVYELQSSCPGLGVLATSRVPLGLAHERVLRLAPLPYDGNDSPAVQLFMATAADLAPDQMPVVQALCEQLDGIPLALELAAARTRAVPPAAILDRLDVDPAIVRTTDPTRPDRHRSLERVLDWSWDLLEPDARAVLRRLSLLAGTFDMPTAVVAAADDSIAGDDVPELVWTLLDHSLLVAEVASGSSRYRVLNPVRSFATGRSHEDEVRRTVSSLGRHFHRALGPERVGSTSWLSEMAVELDNVRAVAADLAGIDDELALDLAWSIGRHHDLTNAYATCIREIEIALGRHRIETPARVALVNLQAYVHLRMGAVDRAAPLLDAAEELADRVGSPPWDEVGLLRTRGDLALRSGDADEAARIAARMLDTATSDGSRSRGWNLLGLALAQAGELGRAADAFEEELQSASSAGIETSLAKIHGNIAEAALQLEMFERAARHQTEALALARSNGEPVLVAYSVMVAARLLLHQGGHEREVAVLHEAALHALAQAGHVLYSVDAGVGDDLRAAVEEIIGADAYAAAAGEGMACPLGTAADRAQRVLEGVNDQGGQ